MAKAIANPDASSLSQAVNTAGKLLRVLEESGLSQAALRCPIDDPDFRSELVIRWEALLNPITSGDSGKCTLAEAAQIMGSNFHGSAAVSRHFGIKLGRQKVFQAMPFSAETLRSVAGTHVLVAVPSLSIMDIHGKASQLFYSSRRNPWFGEPEQNFGYAKTTPGWYLVRKDEVPGSTNKTWGDQAAMLAEPDFVPEANLAVYAYAVHYLATGERMFSRNWVRTESITAGGIRVDLDGDDDGLDVNVWGNDGRGSGIGVASARKPK